MTSATAGIVLALSRWIELSILGKVTIVLMLGLLAAKLSGRARASVRHLIVATALAAVLLLPLVALTSPRMTIEVQPALYGSLSEKSGMVSLSAKDVVTASTSGSEVEGAQSSGPSMPSFSSMIRIAWLGGALLVLLWMCAGVWRLRTLRCDGLPWPEIGDLARSLADEGGIRRDVEVLLHGEIQAPLTCGLRRPAILLPADAREWGDADLRRALVHELEHVRRADWAVQMAARAICACYWFHPLAWAAWRLLRVEAERACDDAVVQSAERTEYAGQLVSLARRLKAHTVPTLGMANRSDLSTRICALLDGKQRRGRAGLVSVSTATALAAIVVLAIAPVSAVTRSVDPSGEAQPEVLRLTDPATHDNQKEALMRINLTSVMVDDQEKALKFYTEVLGFIKKTEVPLGEHKWLTVVSPEGPGDVELLLEPLGFPPARTFQKALFEAGIPLTSFAVDDIQREYDRLVKLGVVFKTKPTQMGPVTVAVFEDTCGNLIQIAQKH